MALTLIEVQEEYVVTSFIFETEGVHSVSLQGLNNDGAHLLINYTAGPTLHVQVLGSGAAGSIPVIIRAIWEKINKVDDIIPPSSLEP